MAFNYTGFQTNDNERTVNNPVWAQMDVKSASTFLSSKNKTALDKVLSGMYTNFKYLDFIVSYNGDNISTSNPPIGLVVDSVMNYSMNLPVLQDNQVTYIPFVNNQRYWCKLASNNEAIKEGSQAYVTVNGLLTATASGNILIPNAFFMADSVDGQLKKNGNDNCLVGLIEFRVGYASHTGASTDTLKTDTLDSENTEKDSEQSDVSESIL